LTVSEPGPASGPVAPTEPDGVTSPDLSRPFDPRLDQEPDREPSQAASSCSSHCRSRSFDAEIRSALRYEKGLAIKGAIVVLAVLALLIAHIYLFS